LSDATWHRKLGAFPSPVYGGGIGRGQAKNSCVYGHPSPTLPRKRGREQTESAALSADYSLRRIPGETRPRFLRVITLEDGETVHNAFFDRNFREEER